MNLSHFKILLIILCTSGILYGQNSQLDKTDFLDINLTPLAYQHVVSTLGVQTLSTAISNDVANIQQVGNFNQATISQLNNNGLNQNIASIIQNNDYNQAQITQNGTANDNSIIQNGNGNQAEINITGDYNKTQIVQTGNNNIASQNINTSATQYIITQIGNNNSIQRYDNIQSPKPYIISQVGNSMHLIITTTILSKQK